MDGGPDDFDQDDNNKEEQEQFQGQQQKEENAETGKQNPVNQRNYQLNEVDLKSVFVNNLEENTTDDDLREYFKDCGVIEKITLRNDKNTGLIYAYILFGDVQAVENAVTISEGMIRGRKIKVYPKRTNLKQLRKVPRGRPMRMAFRGRYSFAAPPRSRQPFRGGYNKYGV